MTDTPRITVITPTFNRAHVLDRAIRSLQGQSLTDYEHVIVDDGSTDGTRDVVAGFGDERIRYFALPERQRANAARNAGLDAARAPLVTFLDSDDEFRPHRLAKTVELFDRNPELDLLSTSFMTERGGIEKESVNDDAVLPPDVFERALIAHAIFIAGSAITARLPAIRAAGSFDPAIHRMQDRDLLLRMARQGGVVLSADIDWTKHDSPDSISRPVEGYIRAFAELASRHPHLKKKYPRIVAYVVARHVLRAALQGRPLLAWSEYRDNRRSPALRFAPAALTAGYVTGKKLRRQIRDEIRLAPLSFPGAAGGAGGMSGVMQAC